MSLTIKVIRGLGDRQSPTTIVCSYFSSEQFFKHVGRVAIDSSDNGFKLVTITLPGIRPAVRVGQIIKLLDLGKEYRGKLKNIAFSVGRDVDGRPFATCSMSLRMKEIL